MLTRIKSIVFVAAVVAAFSGVPIAWGQHGGGGGGHGGGFGGHGGGGFGGHYGGYSGGYLDGGHYGLGNHYYGGNYGYGSGLHLGTGYVYGWPHYYGYSLYPAYPYDYYNSYSDGYYQPYTVSRPLIDVARVEVRLPNDQADVWVQGKKMAAAGAVRRYNSPALEPSKKYVYNISAAWYEGGRLVTQERKIDVRANSAAVVDFTKPEETIRVGMKDRASAPADTSAPPAEPSTAGHQMSHSTDK